MELYELGIKEAQKGLAKGEFSSVELTQAIIDRYHAKNGEIGAYLTFDEEGALALAREFSVDEPIANSSMLTRPAGMKPFAFRFLMTVASYGET